MKHNDFWRIHSRYKDGTELAGEINNELSLTTLGPDDQGRYQCSVKLTADPSLPAVRSEEAMLTITGTGGFYSNAPGTS